MNQDREAVRLKVSVSLETLAGERISEIKVDQVFRDMLGAHVLGTAEAALEALLDTQVVVPCRALIRAHVNKLEEQASFTRLENAGVAPALIDGSIGAALFARLNAVAAETINEEGFMP